MSQDLLREDQKFVGYLDPDKKIRIVRSEHYLWKGHQRIQKARMPYPMPSLIGRWHYHYTNDKKQHISLICTERGRPGGRRVKNKLTEKQGFKIDGIPFIALTDVPWQSRFWEICSGGTCPGCEDADELFLTRKEAEVRILELMK